MRVEGAAGAGAGPLDAPFRCGGFFVVWLDDRPSVRTVPGSRRLDPEVPQAVVDAVSRAPDVLAEALHLRAPRRAWERVEVSLSDGTDAQGEALALGSGCIRLVLGEEAGAEDAAAVARHEALHLLLASSLRGSGKWCDPELAFTDWIVRGIEGGLAGGIPRFRPPLPRLLDPVPASRAEVQRHLGSALDDVEASRHYFGEALFAALQRTARTTHGDGVSQRQLWLVEAALGTHYLEAAARLWADDAAALIPILIDDWLIDYEQYARGLANPPDGAGHLFRIPEPGWSRDPVVRLSVAAQALQGDDHCAFSDAASARDAIVWKNRGRVRLPLIPPADGARPLPLQGFRAALRGIDGPATARARALVEDAARAADGFEARALWPRIFARLLAQGLPWPDVDPLCVPAVQIVDPPAMSEWTAAVDGLRSLLGERAAWIPMVVSAQPRDAAGARPHAASVLLVHDAPPSPESILAARRLAATVPVRGALFRDHLGGGAAHERLPDVPEAIDPRYREEIWIPGALPARLADLPALADEATREGRLTTPLSHLLSISALGLEECHYPREPAAGLRGAPG